MHISGKKFIFAPLFQKGCFFTADVAKLVDALDLGSSAFGRGGSTPFIRTKYPLGHDIVSYRD